MISYCFTMKYGSTRQAQAQRENLPLIEGGEKVIRQVRAQVFFSHFSAESLVQTHHCLGSFCMQFSGAWNDPFTLFLGIGVGEIKGGSLILKLLWTQQTTLLVSGRKGSWRREQPSIFYTEEWNQKWEKRYNQNPPPFYFNTACTS